MNCLNIFRGNILNSNKPNIVPLSFLGGPLVLVLPHLAHGTHRREHPGEGQSRKRDRGRRTQLSGCWAVPPHRRHEQQGLALHFG